MSSPDRQHTARGYPYQPALDGLRALAVLGVLLFHGGVPWLPGGFLGVDAFFVLSGFLITSLLLSEWAGAGRIRLGRFWLRRARRLLPALLLMLVVVVVAFRATLPAPELRLLRGDGLAALGYVANWRMIYRGDDYFAQTSAPSPLQHTWSLGIEEQFYLVWPLILVALFIFATGAWRRGSRRDGAGRGGARWRRARWSGARWSRAWWSGAWRETARRSGDAASQVRQAAEQARQVATALSPTRHAAATMSPLWQAVLWLEPPGHPAQQPPDHPAQPHPSVVPLPPLSAVRPGAEPLPGSTEPADAADPGPDEDATAGRSPDTPATVAHAAGLTAVLAAAGAIGSAVAAALLYRPGDVNRDYFGTDTRAQALLVGCALAALLVWRGAQPARGRVVISALGIAGAVMAGWLWAHAHGTDAGLFRGGLGLDAVAVAAVIAAAVLAPDEPLARLLGLAPLVWLGRISYGVYLWHWPLFALISADRTGLTGPALLGLRIAATLAVATISYVLVEQPIRTGRPLWKVHSGQSRRRHPAAWATASVSVVAAVAVVVVLGTAPPASGPAAPVYAVPNGTAHPRSESGAAPTPMQRPGRRPGPEPRITFFGDSVSWTLGTYLPPHPGLTVTVRAIQGCGIARLPDLLQLGSGGTNYPGCTTWDTRWNKGVVADDPDVSVILLDRWELMDRWIGGAYHHVGEPIYDYYLSHELSLAISVAGSRGAHVVLLTAPYTHRAERPDGGLYDEDQPSRVDAWNRLLYAAAAKDPQRVSVIDLNARVCPDHTFTWNIGSLRIRSDGLHFTESGVQQWIAPWLLPQLADVALGEPVNPAAATTPAPASPGPAGSEPATPAATAPR